MLDNIDMSNFIGFNIQCPYCNNVITINKNTIIPKSGYCPNCGELVEFELPKTSFPNLKLDSEGKSIDNKLKVVQENTDKLLEVLTNMENK